MAPSLLSLLIVRRKNGTFVTASANNLVEPLGVDSDLNQAIETAVREATRISLEYKARVAIDVELANGRIRRDQIINPPLKIRRAARPEG